MGVGKQLTGLLVDQLLEELGVAAYLRDDPCRRVGAPYVPAMDGWKKGQNVYMWGDELKQLILDCPMYARF
jgi:hypothetical protein